MATYKVIQDVEAEDKILGPLTLRQFIYAGIAAFFLYLCYFVISKGATFMLGAFFPPALVFGFFAFPWGRDQPTEVWALAKVRFLIKPRRRIWDQSAIKELVTVTAPKRQGPIYTIKNLSQNEVKSRLLALADTLDSRGWAVKNAYVTLEQPGAVDSSDRLIGMSSLPQQPQAVVDVRAADDILDEKNNPIAQHMNTMIEASTKAHREQIMSNLNGTGPAPAAPSNNYWFMNQPAASSIPDDMVTFNTQVVTPGMDESVVAGPVPGAPTPEEENLVRELAAKQQQSPVSAYYGHMHSIQPLSAQHTQPKPAVAPATASTPVGPAPAIQTTRLDEQHALTQIPAPQTRVTQPLQPQAPAVSTPVVTTPPQVTQTQQTAILQLAKNDDLNVATIAREAKRNGPPNDEVVINLH